MRQIVAVDQNWAIGHQGHLLFSAKEDMRFFMETTLNHVVVMGHSTLDSFADGKPLPHRKNLVLSRNLHLQREGCEIHHHLETLLAACEKYPPNEVFIIGGESIYRLFLPYCNEALVTKFHATAPEADTHYPNLDQFPDWVCVEESAPKEENGLYYTFCTYRRR